VKHYDFLTLSLRGNRCIKIERARKEKLEKLIREPPQREGDSLSVYIGNLDWNVQKIDIKRFLKGCNIGNVRLAVDKATGKFRGFGHVDFSDEISLEKAIKMDQKELLGRPVKISYAVTKRN
jgi:RNA recognition motif-containing protein